MINRLAVVLGWLFVAMAPAALALALFGALVNELNGDDVLRIAARSFALVAAGLALLLLARIDRRLLTADNARSS